MGVATVLYTFSFVMARLVEGDLESRWVRRRRERMLDELTDHFIICGFGRMGFIIAQEFMRQKVPFVIIERNPERMQQAIEAGFLAVEADASSEQVLKRVRIERARGFIAAVEHRRGERLRGADGAAAQARPLHHRPRRDARTPGPSWCGPEPTASCLPTRSAGCSWRRPRSVPRSSTSCRSRPAPRTSN